MSLRKNALSAPYEVWRCQACELFVSTVSTPTLNKSNVTAAAVTRVVCTVFSAVPLGVYFGGFVGKKGNFSLFQTHNKN